MIKKIIVYLIIILLAPILLILGILLLLAPESPESEMYRLYEEEKQKRKKEADEKIAAACQDVPELAENRDPDFLLSVIEDPEHSREAVSEAYALILGITPAGQESRQPLTLSAEQRKKLTELICREKDDSAGISLETFSDQAELRSIYTLSPVSGLRSRALCRMMEIEKKLLREIRQISTVSETEEPDEEMGRFLQKAVSTDNGRITVKFPTEDEMTDDCPDLSYFAEMRGTVWNITTEEELRDLLLGAEKEFHEYALTSEKQSGSKYIGNPWDSAVSSVISHITRYSPAAFMTVLIGDSRVSDDSAERFLKEILSDDCTPEITGQAVAAHRNRRLNSAPEPSVQS